METNMEKSRYLSAYNKGKEDFKELLWHKDTEKPDGNKCIFCYNPETDDYDVAYYESVAKGYFWAYLEDFFSEEMYKEVLKKEKELDEEFREM